MKNLLSIHTFSHFPQHMYVMGYLIGGKKHENTNLLQKSIIQHNYQQMKSKERKP